MAKSDDAQMIVKPSASGLAASVQAVAKKYFADDQLTVATLVPQPRDPAASPRRPSAAPAGDMR